MKRCPKCFGSIRRMGHIEKPFYCPECKEWFSNKEVTPKLTNADHIRSMTDEELAKFISGKARGFGEEYEGYMSALDWLQEPIEDK